MNIIDGKKLAESITNKIKTNIADSVIKPGLAVILVGDDAPSHLYVSLKEKACKEVGIEFHKYLFTADDSKEDILQAIDFLNSDDSIHGILVQIPLPNREWEQEIINRIDPKKDVDGFHPQTIADLLSSKSIIIPGLAQGIMSLIEYPQLPLGNKSCAIICNTEHFAKPLVHLLSQKNIESKVLLKKDLNNKAPLQMYDIIVIAVGQRNFINANQINKNAIVIDVGTNREDGKVFGDVDFNSVIKADSMQNVHITPVPGGVGPMTVAMLLFNTYKLAEYHHHNTK